MAGVNASASTTAVTMGTIVFHRDPSCNRMQLSPRPGTPRYIICIAIGHVRFTPNSDSESGHPQEFMSALPPKADMCCATTDVRFGPKADPATQRSGARTPTSKAADRLFVTGLGTNAHLTFFMEGEPRTEGQKYVRMKYSVCPCQLSER
jgi:hypothetical protein